MATLGGSYSIEIEAPLERCFAIAADVERAPEWQGNMRSAVALERDPQGRPSLVETRIDALVTSVKLRLRFSYAPPSGVTWERESGDLRSLQGSWSFEDLGGGRTRATYALAFDPGRVLSVFARGPMADRVRDHLGGRPPHGLKDAAEGR